MCQNIGASGGLAYFYISVKESYPPSLPPTLPPSLKDELEAKIEKLEAKTEEIRNGAKKQIKDLEDLIVQNKSESDKTIKIDRVYKLTNLTSKDQKQMLGNELFPMIQKKNRDLAGKVTGMILEQDNTKLLRMLDDEEYFTKEVNKALNILKIKP